jgi:hypothetical protein
MPNTHEGVSNNVNNSRNNYIIDLSIESESKAIIHAADQDKMQRIKRTLLFCLQGSFGEETGERNLKFSVEEIPQSFLSRLSSNKLANKLVMEGNITQGLEYLKTFLSDDKYVKAMEKLSTLGKKVQLAPCKNSK